MMTYQEDIVIEFDPHTGPLNCPYCARSKYYDQGDAVGYGTTPAEAIIDFCAAEDNLGRA